MRKFRHTLLTLFVAFAACAGTSCNKPTPSSTTDAETETDLIIAKEGVSQFSLIYSGNKRLVSGLDAFIQFYTGAKLNSATIYAEPSDYEIIVGYKGRTEISEALKELDAKFGYVVKVSGSKLVIAGTDVSWTSLGVKEFVRQAKESLLNGKDLIVPKNLNAKESSDNPQMIARLIKSGDDFELEASQLFSCSGGDGLTIAQGAAGDGTYAYIVMRNSADDQARIYKYSLSSYSQLDSSPIFNGGHCNDMTFDDAKGQLIVAHGQTQGKILTPVTAKTLTPLTDINISVGSGAITYNSSRGNYAISQGGKTLYITDGDFNVLKSSNRTDGSSYTAQGMGSDDEYIYFPMSGSSDNVLIVYSWDCKYITTLTLPVAMESESMFYAAGRYFVNFYQSGSGAVMQEIKPIMYYTFSKNW